MLLTKHQSLYVSAQGLADLNGSIFVPAAARQRHAPGGGGGPGLFTGRRIFLTMPPAGSLSVRPSSTGGASKAALVSQMVAAEGGSLARALGQGEGGGSRGAASPSPSPEGATLMVCLAQGLQEARAALKMAQVGVWAGMGRELLLACTRGCASAGLVLHILRRTGCAEIVAL